MIFEISGTKIATGERVKAKVQANSLEDAIARLVRNGIAPRPGSNMNVSAGPKPDSKTDTAKTNQAKASNGRSATSSAAPNAGEEKPHSASADTQRAADPQNPGHTNRRRNSWLVAGAITVAVLIVVSLAITFGSRSPSSTQASANQVTTAEQTTPSVSESAPSPAPVRPLPANVVRSDDGKLEPAPGYTWVTANAGDFSVRWVSGEHHPDYANITSAQKEGYWNADPGYSFPSKDSLRVQWKPGARDPKHPNVEAGDSPGKWRPLPGYTWVFPDDLKSMSVRWKAGILHPTAPHVVSGPNEGNWRPASGYRWASDKAGDFSVVRAGPTEEQLQSASSMVVLALLFDAAGDKANDGSLGGAFVHDLMKGGRNDAIRKALTDLFPNESPLTISAAANIIILGADGRLTADDWTSATARDALVARIRKEAPSVADAYQLAEFIGSVLDTYEQRQR